MSIPLSRRRFIDALLSGAASYALGTPATRAAGRDPFAFLLLGDLHFDRWEHHDREWLQSEKPNDVHQVQEYTRLTREILPRLFGRLGETITELGQSADTRIAFVLQVGDFVEGLCGAESLATQQNTEAVSFVRQACLGVPFLFTKGNHDITGPGAPEAFKAVFQPFLAQQTALLGGSAKLAGARFNIEQGEALFCFFDAYDKESLGWLEAVLARRTARHCFVVVHPPVVPYGARSTWHLFSSDRDKTQREHLLDLLGTHGAFVLSGHIHKYNLLTRATPRGGKFLQAGLSSVISAPEMQAQHILTGISQYTPEQVKVEPDFSPATEQQRRAIYEKEREFVRQFQYADLPGYAVIKVNGPQVTLDVFSGASRQLWRNLNLPELLTG